MNKGFGMKMQVPSAEVRTLLCCVLMSWRSHNKPYSRWQRSHDPWDTVLQSASASTDYKCVCVTCRMSLTSNPVGKPLSVLLFYPPPFIYDHFKKQCIVNFLPQMRSNTYRALPTTLSITINVNSALHLSPFYYNAGNVKCICNSQNTALAPRLTTHNITTLGATAVCSIL